MGVAVPRKRHGDRSGHTLKGSQSPGEAEAGVLTTVGGSGGTENLKGQPQGAGRRGVAQPEARYVLRVNPLKDRATP